MESCTLCNDVSRVLFPGEFLEICDNNVSNYEGEIATEPRFDSHLNGELLEPCLSRVIHGTIRIPDLTNEPVQLSKSQTFFTDTESHHTPSSSSIHFQVLLT